MSLWHWGFSCCSRDGHLHRCARYAQSRSQRHLHVPRPEWYFLFLFKFLALYGQIPVLGKIEFIATVVIPGIVVGALALLPFIEKSLIVTTATSLPISIIASSSSAWSP